MRRWAVILFAGCSSSHIVTIPAGYALERAARSPKGTMVEGADPVEIDRIVDEVEQCLTAAPRHPYERLPIDRGSFSVKVASDWLVSCADPNVQVLPRAAPAGCDPNKHQDQVPCPCHWRALIQPDRTIVTTPDLGNFRDPLVRFVTQFQRIWEDPDLARCATP